MKVLNTILFITANILFLSSCSKCYECETLREFNNVQDTVVEDICTASGEEIEELEAEGAKCTPSGF